MEERKKYEISNKVRWKIRVRRMTEFEEKGNESDNKTKESISYRHITIFIHTPVRSFYVQHGQTCGIID